MSMTSILASLLGGSLAGNGLLAYALYVYWKSDKVGNPASPEPPPPTAGSYWLFDSQPVWVVTTLAGLPWGSSSQLVRVARRGEILLEKRLYAGAELQVVIAPAGELCMLQCIQASTFRAYAVRVPHGPPAPPAVAETATWEN